MATAALQVPVEQVTLDARFVAETIARVWEVAERVVAFSGADTNTSTTLDQIGEDIYRAAFGPPTTGGLFDELVTVSEDLAKDPFVKRGRDDA